MAGSDQFDSLRSILLGMPIDDETATQVIAKLLFFQAQDPSLPVTLYVNSPGGSITATLAVLEVMAAMKYPIKTVCLNMAAGAAAMIVAAGTRGRRFAMRNAVLMLARTTQGKRSEESETALKFLEKLNQKVVDHLSRTCSQNPEVIVAGMECERQFTAKEARAFGMVDKFMVDGV